MIDPRIHRIFEAVVGLSEPDRTDAVRRLCEGDAALESRVLDLLRSADRASIEGFLGHDPFGGIAPTAATPGATPHPCARTPFPNGSARTASSASSERGLRHRLPRRAARAVRREAAEGHQGRHGLGPGDRQVRGRASGPGDHGARQHRQGLRRPAHRSVDGLTSLLRDGARRRGAHHRVLRPQGDVHSAAARPVPPGLLRGPARAHQGCDPSGHQAVERARLNLRRRRADRQGHRLRRRQGPPPAALRCHALHRAGPAHRDSGVHEPRAGRGGPARRRHQERCLLAGRAAVRTSGRRPALRPHAALNQVAKIIREQGPSAHSRLTSLGQAAEHRQAPAHEHLHTRKGPGGS